MTELLDAAGFVDVRQKDVTPEFARTTRAYLETSERFSKELQAEWGADKFVESQHDRRMTLTLIREGVVRRGMFTARRPG